ncbi:MAG: hypothetical protein RBS73_05345 [Prolixibacteraceae bacterium]|jgi:hypothetical protein|nr:hypothetical protein [Prolixibacteraceae bacterium]
MRKIVIIIFLSLLIAGGAAWYFLSLKNTVAFTDNSAFKAVPIHSPLVVELPNIEAVVQAFSEGNMMIAEMKNAGILSHVSDQVGFIGELIKSDADFARLCKNKPVLISASFGGRNEVSFIFLVSLKDKKEQNLVIETIRRAGGRQELPKRDYDNTDIYWATVNNSTFSFAFTNGIFVACQKPILVEEVVRQSNAESLLDHSDFVKLNKTSNANAIANIYINHKTAGQLLVRILNRDVRRKIGFLANYAEYTELDLNLKPDEFFLNGFTFSNDSSESYANLFKGQAPGKSDFESVLPSNTSLFISLNIEKPEEFLRDYETFSRISGSYYQRQARLMTIKNETKTDFSELVDEIFTGVSGIAFTSVTQNDPVRNRFFVMGIKSQSTAREKLEFLLKKYAAISKTDTKNWQTEFRVDEKRKFTLYQFPYPDISEVLFGKIYSGIACNFFTFYDNHLVFADSQAALKEFIHNLVLGETLSKDVNYIKFKENTSSRSNLHFYVNFSRAFHLSRQYLDGAWAKEWNSHEENMRKFYALSWQLSNTNELILNTIYLKFDPLVKEEPQTIWQAPLDSHIFTKPKIVTNHNDPANSEVIFQDQANNLYLINKEGATLWKVKLQEPVLSDISQVDIYRNNKLQYLFNTRLQLYLIDRNGETVKGYPVAFRSPAANGVAVVDYDNKKDYRFFVACEDKQIYAYSKDGKFLKGWNNFACDNLVEKPIQHMRVQDKDYLVFFDRYKTYFLDRQGNERLHTKASFEHSGNELILEQGPQPAILCTDKKGVVYKLFFDENFKKLEPGKFSGNHYFTSADINGNGQNDFIFADGSQLNVYAESGVKLFSKEMKKAISAKPEIFIFGGKNKKIGVVSASENRVYLFNPDGSVYEGFPLQGNSRFCIGTLSKGNKFFNLLVGNEDGSFFNYMVE